MTRVLVPVAVLEGEAVSPGLLTLLDTVDVTVLGYQVVPEQTPPDQARLQYEERATAALEDLTREFRTAGGAADHRLVFTQDRERTIDRVADELGARAVAISGMTGDVERVLVSLSGAVAVERILEFAVELIGDRDIGVTLFLASEDDTATERVESAAQRLREADIDVGTVVAGGPPFDALVERVASHDVVITGEKAPSLRSLVFEDKADRVASATVGPVLVVRYESAPDEHRTG